MREKQIIVTLREGAIVSVKGIPNDTELVIRDYDVEEYVYPEDFLFDESGNPFIESIWNQEIT